MMKIFICILIVLAFVNAQNEYRIHTNDAEDQRFSSDLAVTPSAEWDGEFYFIAHGKDADPASSTFDLVMYLLVKHIPSTKENVVVLTLHQTPGEMATAELTELINIVMSGDNMYIFFEKIIYTYVPATGYFHALPLVAEDANVVQGDIVGVFLDRIDSENDLALPDGLGGVYWECAIHDYQYDFVRGGVQRTAYKKWYSLCKLEGGNGLETTISTWYSTYSDINATYAISDIAIYNDEVVVSWATVIESRVVRSVSVFSDGPVRSTRLSPGADINQGLDIPIYFKVLNNDLYFFRYYTSSTNKGVLNTLKYSGSTSSTIDLESLVARDLITGVNFTLSGSGFMLTTKTDITAIGDTLFIAFGTSRQVLTFQNGVYTEVDVDAFSGFKEYNNELYLLSNWYEISKINAAGEVSIVHQSATTATVNDFRIIGGNVLVLSRNGGVPSIVFNNGESDVQISGSELNAGSRVAMLQYGRNILYSVPYQLYVKDYCGAILDRSHSWSSGLGELTFTQTRCDVTHSITIEFMNLREEFAAGVVKKRHGDGWRGWRDRHDDDDEEDRHNNHGDRDWSENHGHDNDEQEGCDDDEQEGGRGGRHREGHGHHDNHGRRHGHGHGHGHGHWGHDHDENENNCPITESSQGESSENTQESNGGESSEDTQASNSESSEDTQASSGESEDTQESNDGGESSEDTQATNDNGSSEDTQSNSEGSEDTLESYGESSSDSEGDQSQDPETEGESEDIDTIIDDVESSSDEVSSEDDTDTNQRVTTVDVVTTGEGSVIDGSDVVIDSKTTIFGDIRPIDSEPLGFSLNAYQLDKSTAVDVDGVSVTFPEGTLLVEFSITGLSPGSNCLVDLGLTSTFANSLTSDTHSVIFSPETETCTMNPTLETPTGTIIPDECIFASGDYGETYPVRLVVKADGEGTAFYRYWSMTLPTLNEERFLSSDNLEEEQNNNNNEISPGSTTLIILLIIAAVAGTVIAVYQFSKSELSKVFD